MRREEEEDSQVVARDMAVCCGVGDDGLVRKFEGERVVVSGEEAMRELNFWMYSV